jgi:hypothetical protein
LCNLRGLGILDMVSSPLITILFFTLILFSACNGSERTEVQSGVYKRDSVYRYFNNEPFRLVGDTLYAASSAFVLEYQYATLKLEVPKFDWSTSFTSMNFRFYPEFNFIFHNPDEEDTLFYNTYSDLAGQQPTRENHKDYFELACVLWEFNKLGAAEKMFLNILESKADYYTSIFYHDSDIPGDTTVSTYGYGSYTSHYKNSACIFLTKIYIEQKKFNKALAYLNDAINKYQTTYTCGTGYKMQQDQYRFYYAACYKGLGRHQELLDLLLPHCLDWNDQILIGAIRKMYSGKQIQQHLAEAENSITCQTDTFESFSYTYYPSDSSRENADTSRYFTGTGSIKLFNRIIELPRPSLENGERLSTAYFLKLFRESSFYTSLAKKQKDDEL